MKVIIDFYNQLTPSIKASIWITLCILIVLIILRIMMRDYTADKPAKGIIILCESFVGLFNDFAKEMTGKRWRFFAPYFLTISIFIFLSNISGMFGFTPPTVSASVTLTLSVLSFLLIQTIGISSNGIKGYLKGMVTPIPMTPLNIIGELAVPISLGFRLFGNILSGAILSVIVFSLLGWASILLTPLLSVIFDIAFGFLQTLVFVMLTAVFISNKLSDDEFVFE